MNALNLLEQHPKAAAIIKDYYLKKLLSTVNSDILTEEFKEVVVAKGVTVESLLSIINKVPRNLFDVFDEHELHVEVLVNYQDKPSIFTYTVVEGDLIYTQPTKYTTRIEAEKAAIVEAFKVLEEKL
jgi:hypothetical protein